MGNALDIMVLWVTEMVRLFTTLHSLHVVQHAPHMYKHV